MISTRNYETITHMCIDLAAMGESGCLITFHSKLPRSPLGFSFCIGGEHGYVSLHARAEKENKPLDIATPLHFAPDRSSTFLAEFASAAARNAGITEEAFLKIVRETHSFASIITIVNGRRADYGDLLSPVWHSLLGRMADLTAWHRLPEHAIPLEARKMLSERLEQAVEDAFGGRS